MVLRLVSQRVAVGEFLAACTSATSLYPSGVCNEI